MGFMDSLRGGMDQVLHAGLPFGQSPSEVSIERRRDLIAQKKAVPSYDGSWRDENPMRVLGEAEEHVYRNFRSLRAHSEDYDKLQVAAPLFEQAHKHYGDKLFRDEKLQRKVIETVYYLRTAQIGMGFVRKKKYDWEAPREAEYTKISLDAMRSVMEAADDVLTPLDLTAEQQRDVKIKALAHCVDNESSGLDILQTAALYTDGAGQKLAKQTVDPALLAQALQAKRIYSLGESGSNNLRAELCTNALKNPHMDPMLLTGVLYGSKWSDEEKMLAFNNTSLPKEIKTIAALDPDLSEDISKKALGGLEDVDIANQTILQSSGTLSELFKGSGFADALSQTGVRPTGEGLAAFEEVASSVRLLHSGATFKGKTSPGMEIEDMVGAYLSDHTAEYVLFPNHPWNQDLDPVAAPVGPDDAPKSADRLVNWNPRTSRQPALENTRVFRFSNRSENVPPSKELLLNTMLEGNVRMLDACATLALIDADHEHEYRAALAEHELWTNRPALNPVREMMDEDVKTLQKSLDKALGEGLGEGDNSSPSVQDAGRLDR